MRRAVLGFSLVAALFLLGLIVLLFYRDGAGVRETNALGPADLTELAVPPVETPTSLIPEAAPTPTPSTQPVPSPIVRPTAAPPAPAMATRPVRFDRPAMLPMPAATPPPAMATQPVPTARPSTTPMPSPTPSREPFNIAESPPATGPFSADEALRTYGSIAFNSPAEIQIEKSHVIQLLLDPSGVPPEVLGSQIIEPGDVQTARIRISDTVEAKLAGSAFEIRTITPEVQAVSNEEPTEWRWEIIPKESGTHRLFLTINALIPAEGVTERRRAIRTFDRTITVLVRKTPLSRILLPSAIAVIIASMVVIVVLDRRRGRLSGDATVSAVATTTLPRGDDAEPGQGIETIRDSSSPSPPAAPRAITRTLTDGEVVAGRYVIAKFLGRGGMGAVYAAEDRELGELVALKTMLPAAPIDDRSLRRFRREIQYARRVAHPNVCRIHDLGQHRIEGIAEPLLFVSMEIIDGVTLGSLIRAKGRLTESEALPIITQIAAGLEATHAAGLVHRDLKPANIMLTNDLKRAVLMDFGLARLSTPAAGELSITETGAIVGSPVYMAPEQLEDGAVSPATDIYAFGAVIYEMITGLRPFDGESAISLIAQRLHGQPIPPSARCPDVSEIWERTILRCLARRPEDRFKSASEAERALRGLMPDEVTLEMPAGN